MQDSNGNQTASQRPKKHHHKNTAKNKKQQHPISTVAAEASAEPLLPEHNASLCKLAVAIEPRCASKEEVRGSNI